MSKIKLRDYQSEAIAAVNDAHAGGMDFPAVVLPTGAGKTVIFADMAARFVREHRRRVLVLVHRDELADQAITKITANDPALHVGKIKAKDNGVHATVMVASVQTLSRRDRLDQLVSTAESGTFMSEVGLIITDEVHHAAAPSYRAVYDAFPNARLAGFTATLARGDGVGLGSVIDDVVYSRSVLWMISRGHLCDVRGHAITLDSLDLSQVKKSGGDYQAASLGSAMIDAGSPSMIARTLALYAKHRRSIVFCPDVASAMATHKAVPYSAVIHGKTPREDRQLIYKQFEHGDIRTIVNCMVLTEGFDAPWADCAVIARPTQSAPLYVQMVGRVLRTWPGKADALVLDITGTGGKLSTLIDLAPGEVRTLRHGESLAEAAIRTETELNTVIPADSLAFALKHRDLDMFASSSHAWLATDGGVMFIPVGNAFIFLWARPDGTWDVCGAPARGKWRRLHHALPLGSAMAWAETEAEDRMPFNGTKTARWRKESAHGSQIGKARQYGYEIPDDPRKGDMSDLIARGQATQKFDDHMRKV